jgi:TRAP-type C4-dicarboxylate transport system substrate-binding protein
MSSQSLGLRLAALVLAVGTCTCLTMAAPAFATDYLPCFSVPSHWEGQQNTDPQHSYHVELRFEWNEATDHDVLVTFLGPDGNLQGPFDAQVSVKNGKIVFVDSAQNTFTLRCTGGKLKAELSRVAGNGATPTGTIDFSRLPS